MTTFGYRGSASPPVAAVVVVVVEVAGSSVTRKMVVLAKVTCRGKCRKPVPQEVIDAENEKCWCNAQWLLRVLFRWEGKKESWTCPDCGPPHVYDEDETGYLCPEHCRLAIHLHETGKGKKANGKDSSKDGKGPGKDSGSRGWNHDGNDNDCTDDQQWPYEKSWGWRSYLPGKDDKGKNYVPGSCWNKDGKGEGSGKDGKGKESEGGKHGKGKSSARGSDGEGEVPLSGPPGVPPISPVVVFFYHCSECGGGDSVAKAPAIPTVTGPDLVEDPANPGCSIWKYQ